MSRALTETRSGLAETRADRLASPQNGRSRSGTIMTPAKISPPPITNENQRAKPPGLKNSLGTTANRECPRVELQWSQ